ncbi:TonB family protein [Sandaracinus amylolyticus]|nr:TonB family protein [Sandaracinus amylolyticus]
MDAYAAHVRRYIREYYIRRAQMCFDHESRVDQQAVRGTVVIGFTIQGSGEVTGAQIERNTTGRDALAACLQRQVEDWRLPRPPEGVDELPMQMPFSR